MYVGESMEYGMRSLKYRHRIKGSQQAYVLCDEADAEDYAKRNNLAVQHKEK